MQIIFQLANIVLFLCYRKEQGLFKALAESQNPKVWMCNRCVAIMLIMFGKNLKETLSLLCFEHYQDISIWDFVIKLTMFLKTKKKIQFTTTQTIVKINHLWNHVPYILCVHSQMYIKDCFRLHVKVKFVFLSHGWAKNGSAPFRMAREYYSMLLWQLGFLFFCMFAHEHEQQDYIRKWMIHIGVKD